MIIDKVEEFFLKITEKIGLKKLADWYREHREGMRYLVFGLLTTLLNLLIFILEMINSFINNHSFQITTIYCLFNFIKLVHIITFDDNLMDLYKEDKYLLFLKNFFESCKNSKIIYTNYYINPNEKKSTILKTIPESIMDICIKTITSDIIKYKHFRYKKIINFMDSKCPK